MTRKIQQLTSASSGQSQTGSQTVFFPVAGFITGLTTTEAAVAFKVNDSFTVVDLLTVVTANTLSGVSTLKSRVALADGNLAVSIGAGATGTFEDTADSDSLVSGNQVDYELIVGAAAANSITQTQISTVFQHSTAFKGHLIAPDLSGSIQSGSSSFIFVNGAAVIRTEANIKFKSEIAFTWSLLTTAVHTNSLSGGANTTSVSRINGADGSQSSSIAGGATGLFQDTVDSDSIVAGNSINYGLHAGGTSGSITDHFQGSLTNSVKNTQQLSINGEQEDPLNASTTYYMCPQGAEALPNTTESITQYKVRAQAYVITNLYLFISTNGITVASSAVSRMNAANGNLSASIASSTTGVFEDTVDNDSVGIGDLYNYAVVIGSSGSSLKLDIEGTTWTQKPFTMLLRDGA